MSGNQTTLPENFYTMTSDMLLVAPEPQYLFATMLLAALGASLEVPTELGMPGRTVGGVGAPYTPAERDRLILADPLPSALIGAKVDFNAVPGSTVRINRPSFANTTYTMSSRRVPSGTTLSTTAINVGSQQANLTLERFAGPYSSSASAVAPYAVEKFDASVGVHNMAQIHGTHIKRDFHRTLNGFCNELLGYASSAIYPEGMSAVNDATSAGQFPFSYEQITRTHSTMNESNLPTLPDGFRMLVLSSKQIQQLQNDPDYLEAGQVFPQYNALFPQYVKSVGKFHIFEDTTLTVTANSSSVNIHYGHAIAPGALMAGMGGRPRVANSTNDNYGETVLVMWIAYLGLGLANNTFVVSVRSSA